MDGFSFALLLSTLMLAGFWAWMRWAPGDDEREEQAAQQVPHKS